LEGADERLGDALARWLAERLSVPKVQIRELMRHTEGFSWQTYTLLAEWETAAGERRQRGFAVRREPEEGTLERYDAAQQFRIGRALYDCSDVPLPAVYWLETNSAVLERPFYVMERIEGRVPVPWDAHNREVFPDDGARGRLGRDFVEVLARVHAVDIAGAGLDFLGPPPSPDAAAHAAIAYWERLYEEAQRGELPLLRWAFQWLRANVATSGRLTLVHGDYRIGNFMIDAKGRINAVFDWELAHVGDPIFDLAYGGLRLYRGRSPLLSQLLSAEEMFAAYEEHTGLAVAPEVFHFWTVVGYVRALTQYVRAVRAFADGRTDDLRLAAMSYGSLHLLKYLAEELGLRSPPA
jgi:aminoglycoside phosphotransferase (APT) family kinase protein